METKRYSSKEIRKIQENFSLKSSEEELDKIFDIIYVNAISNINNRYCFINFDISKRTQDVLKDVYGYTVTKVNLCGSYWCISWW